MTIWQIDSFEGGKGSRAGYLQRVASEFSKQNNCYVSVDTLSADAARENLKRNVIPDMISYGAGTYGIESIIGGDKPYYTWCRGGYCFLTVDESADFSDITVENTVINGGTDNLSGAAALFSGLNGAAAERPTGAYVNLLNGKYKYLLGTQRDIYRLKTREKAFKIKAITDFNDLYQNISVTNSCKNKLYAQKFIELLLSKSDVNELGLMQDGKSLHSDEVKELENLSFGFRLTSPITENFRNEINSAITNSDLNLLKKLLK